MRNQEQRKMDQEQAKLKTLQNPENQIHIQADWLYNKKTKRVTVLGGNYSFKPTSEKTAHYEALQVISNIQRTNLQQKGELFRHTPQLKANVESYYFYKECLREMDLSHLDIQKHHKG